MPEDLEPPLTVLVTETRWSALDRPTPRNIELVRILTEMGGVSDTTPPGTYHFNVEVLDGLTAAATLERVK